MSKHTPGPWKLAFDFFSGGKQRRSVDSMNDCRIAVVEVFQSNPGSEWEETNEANARLIAAAPDLLNSAKVVYPFLLEAIMPIVKIAHPELAEGFAKSVDVLRRVIEKAEGG